MGEFIVCCAVTAVEAVAGKDTLKAVTLDKGDGAAFVVVTNAPNVTAASVGKKVVAALVGASVKGVDVRKATVGGRTSEGMLCDSSMLGWSGGGVGTAVFLDDTVDLGSPRPAKAVSLADAAPAVEQKPLFEKKLTKEEKKLKAAAEKEARKAKKRAAALAAVAGPTEGAEPPTPDPADAPEKTSAERSEEEPDVVASIPAPAPSPTAPAPAKPPPPQPPAADDAPAADTAAVASVFGKKKKKTPTK